MIKTRNVLFTTFILLVTTLLIRCSDNDDVFDEETGEISIKITDAPSDDPNIQGTFITVSDVKLDGESAKGFTKQTIDISAYRQGEAKLLIADEIKAKSYSSIALVFDYESDDSGNSPGCYVLTEDNQKHDLAAQSQSQSEITFTGEFVVDTNQVGSFVVDFDMRKAITRDTVNTTTNTDYKFVTSAEMQNALRIVNEKNSGEVNGNVSGTLGADNEMYVYIYRKGEFNTSTETQGQGSSNILFANAVTSAKVNSDGSYNLSFLQEGEYEIHMAAYSTGNEQMSEFDGMLNTKSIISGILLNDITVAADTKVTVDINILGLI